MYKIKCEFPETGEWSMLIVDTLCEAWAWYKCKAKGRNVLKTTITMMDRNDRVFKQLDK